MRRHSQTKIIIAKGLVGKSEIGLQTPGLQRTLEMAADTQTAKDAFWICFKQRILTAITINTEIQSLQ